MTESRARIGCVATALLLALGLFACEFHVDKLQDWDSSMTMGFTTLKARVFDTHCISCHGPAGGTQGGLDLTEYEAARRAAPAIEAQVSSGAMPPASAAALSERQKGWIRAWAAAGAPLEDQLSVPAPAASDGSDDALYLQVRERIFVPQCVRCHGEEKQKGDVRVDTYAFALQHLPAIEKAVLVDDLMPPRESLPDEDKALLRAWIDSR